MKKSAFWVLALVFAVAGSVSQAGQDEKKPESKQGTSQTPFGPASSEPSGGAARVAPTQADSQRQAKPLIDVKIDGDTVTFTRRTPFGKQTWKKESGDLTDFEQELYDDKLAETSKAGPSDAKSGAPAKPRIGQSAQPAPKTDKTAHEKP